MAEVIVLGDDDEGIVDARTLWRPKYVAEKQARDAAEAQTTQLQNANDQLRTEAASEKRARETAEAQTTQLQTENVQLRTEAAHEKRARETAEAQTTQLQTENVQLRTKAASEKRARETAKAQTTQLQIDNVQLRTEAASEKRARETAEAQTTQLQYANVQLRTEAASEKRARKTAEAQTTQLQYANVQLRTEAAHEKRARETAEAQTTQLQNANVQLRTEAAHEKRARETAEAQTTQLQNANVKLRVEAAHEKRARETAEEQLQKLSDELESTKATVRELQSATDALREELTLSATAQGKQEKDTAMAERKRLGPELAIAAGTSTQLQKERAVMMEVQAQVTAIDAVEAFTQASLDPSREERCTLQYLYQNLGEHRDRATEGSSNNAASKTSLLLGCQWVSPATSPRQKDDGLGLGENLPATAMSPTLAISAQSAPGARAFKVGGPGNVVAVSQSQEATTIEPLHFDVPYMFQRGKLGKGDEGKKFFPQHYALQ
jgi:hypothetical protein